MVGFVKGGGIMKTMGYMTTIDELAYPVNGYHYRINIFKFDYLACQTYYSFSTYAETETDAKELSEYYNNLSR